VSQELNNLFRNDPFAFARANVLWPGDAEGVNGLQPNTSTNMFKANNNIATGESLFQLKGASRIWSCDLNRNGTRVMLTKGLGAVNAPAMAMYYLPWPGTSSSERRYERRARKPSETRSQPSLKIPPIQPPFPRRTPTTQISSSPPASTVAWWWSKVRARSRWVITAMQSRSLDRPWRPR